jgi:hypothetical protein
LGRLNENFGWVGIEYAKFLAKNHERLEAEVTELSKKFETSLKLVQNERFWGATAATILCGAKYGNELGFTEIELTPLEEFLVKTIHGLRLRLNGSVLNDLSSPDNLAAFLSGFMDYVGPDSRLVTNVFPTKGGSHNKVTIESPGLHKALVYQIAKSDKLLRIKCKQLHDYIVKSNAPPSVVINALKKAFGMQQVKVFMGAGTTWADPFQSQCWEFNLNHQKLSQFVAS